MAQIFKLRKARVFCFTVIAALLLGGGEAAPVWSLSLPLETPTAPVQAPAPPVKTPTVTVKTPTVPVAVPAVPAPPPVKTPTVPVKVPTVPVKTPSVPVKTTTSPVKTTTSANVPSISIKTPTVSVKAPSVSADTPVGSVRTTTGSVRTPTVSATGLPGQTPRPSASGGSSRGTLTGEGASGGSGAPASTAPLGAYGSPGAGFGELPPTEGAPGKRARARIASRERLLKATVARFQGCLVALPASNRRVLELRTGYGEAGPLSPRAAAARLHLGARKLAHQEKQALHELSEAAATHDCARTGEVVEAAISLIGAGLGGHAGTGQTEVASFKASRPPASTPGSTLVGRVLGVNVPRVANDILLVLLAIFGCAVLLLVADAAGIGPRHEQWRRRVVNRVRTMR